jgi:hypothetical protein
MDTSSGWTEEEASEWEEVNEPQPQSSRRRRNPEPVEEEAEYVPSSNDEVEPGEEEEEEEQPSQTPPPVTRPRGTTTRQAPKAKAKAEPKAKAAPRPPSRTAALTGVDARFPILGFKRSMDAALNVAWELHARLVTFKWKVLLLGLRMRQAIGARWRRNTRWQAALLGRELAAIYGTMGAASQYVRGPKGPLLLR